MRYLGAHINGGFSRAFDLSEKLDINSVQVMPTAPMRWSLKDIPVEKAALLSDEKAVENLKRSPLKKILLHGVYLINLARKDKQKFHLSKMSLLTYLQFSEQLDQIIKKSELDLDVLGTCFHPGSVIDQTESEAIKRIGYGINWIFNKAEENGVTESKLLLESTAGAGNVMGDTVEELARMKDEVEDKYQERVGFVLDTQHMWASGYNWKEDLNVVMDKVESSLGWENIASIHLNDSMTDFASNKDRHADLGEGKIGEDAIKALINHEKIVENKVPVIMEVPSLKDENGIKTQMQKLVKLAED